jgi:hypothetical protein
MRARNPLFAQLAPDAQPKCAARNAPREASVAALDADFG